MLFYGMQGDGLIGSGYWTEHQWSIHHSAAHDSIPTVKHPMLTTIQLLVFHILARVTNTCVSAHISTECGYLIAVSISRFAVIVGVRLTSS